MKGIIASSSGRKFCAKLLVLLMAVPGGAWAADNQEASPTKLNLVIVEGEGAINNIRQRTAREPIVQVEDENHKPVAGAAVLFMLPDKGASGTFANGARTLAVTTDSNGRAVAKGYRANQTSGKFQISVEASYQGVTTKATISQANAVLTAGAALSGKMIALIAVLGGAAVAGGVYAGTRGGSSTPPPSPTVITAGPGTVGGPR
jgi:hypothetical protein